MSAKISNTFLLATLMFGATAVFAQEIPGQDLNGVNYQENSYDDKPLLYEEGKPSPKSIIVRDTAYARPSAATPAKPKAVATPDNKKPAATSNGPTANPEADPLNFNFLYYIFQKFKASDLMMEE
jgi:hypothetical protein